MVALRHAGGGREYSALVHFAPPVCSPGGLPQDIEGIGARLGAIALKRSQTFDSPFALAKSLFRSPVFGRASLDREGYELRCPREYEAQVFEYLFVWSMTVEFERVVCPVKVIGSDPTVRNSCTSTTTSCPRRPIFSSSNSRRNARPARSSFRRRTGSCSGRWRLLTAVQFLASRPSEGRMWPRIEFPVTSSDTERRRQRIVYVSQPHGDRCQHFICRETALNECDISLVSPMPAKVIQPAAIGQSWTQPEGEGEMFPIEDRHLPWSLPLAAVGFRVHQGR